MSHFFSSPFAPSPFHTLPFPHPSRSTPFTKQDMDTANVLSPQPIHTNDTPTLEQARAAQTVAVNSQSMVNGQRNGELSGNKPAGPTIADVWVRVMFWHAYWALRVTHSTLHIAMHPIFTTPVTHKHTLIHYCTHTSTYPVLPHTAPQAAHVLYTISQSVGNFIQHDTQHNTQHDTHPRDTPVGGEDGQGMWEGEGHGGEQYAVHVLGKKQLPPPSVTGMFVGCCCFLLAHVFFWLAYVFVCCMHMCVCVLLACVFMCCLHVFVCCPPCYNTIFPPPQPHPHTPHTHLNITQGIPTSMWCGAQQIMHSTVGKLMIYLHASSVIDYSAVRSRGAEIWRLAIHECPIHQ